MNISISNAVMTAEINPHGAELTSLQKNGREYIWEGNPEFWGKHSPILFPIVGTLKNNSYHYKGNHYSMTRHGFARDTTFSIKAQDKTSVTFSLSANENTLKAYPFNFQLDLKYTLKDKTLCLDYTVINEGGDIMPFSLGAHPAFALPGNFTGYSLTFARDTVLTSARLENDLIADKTAVLPLIAGKLPLSYDLFKNDALIFKSLVSDAIDITDNDNPMLRVEFKNFPHMGIWTKENAPFLCIEPWQGFSDSYNSNGNILEKEGIVALKPKERFNAGLTIEILS
jgi:galactose mutarotase-like enzyme